ncbi:unnamed protein product [Gongylonema pulchrum]|uniref:WWE domain-containing protein n=1 Tax=Gongylonema pulchrum TaxID=637853 RepID=A0A183DRK0_9BILA|nr:unnamed protein product [Gongylonema pulchrum]
MDLYIWKYWDAEERTGSFKWLNYPIAASHHLTNALLAGEKSCKVSVAGRQFLVDFVTMSQQNLDTRIERPIMITGRLKKGIRWDRAFRKSDAFEEWEEFLRERLVISTVTLLRLENIDESTVHAILILVTRITRDFKIANTFLEHEGIQALMKLSGVAVPAVAQLVTLIVRHCLDDEVAVGQIFEKAILLFRIPQTTRDWLHAIRVLAPLCAREPEIFLITMERVARRQKDEITVLPMGPTDPHFRTWAAQSPIKQVIVVSLVTN